MAIQRLQEPLDVLLDHLKRNRGFDFTGYKRSSLERRIALRMQAVGAEGYLDYLDQLEVRPDEFAALFNTILINVTAFFRDKPAWDYLSSDVLPRILEGKPPDAPIRVWCAGCASGEETYSLAMALAEAMGEEAYARRVKIYATDVDEEALNHARLATYTARDVADIPRDLLTRYFEPAEDGWAFRKDLRRTLIFGRNDLVRDAPISRVDLLSCRNTLIYFNAETQSRILGRLHFALNETGVLFMGKSEMLITHSELFAPVNLRRRFFSKVAKPAARDRFAHLPNPLADRRDNGAGGVALRDSAFEAAPLPQIVIDRNGCLAMANEQARRMLSLGADEVGRPLKDLQLSYRPVELRSHLDLAWTERREALIEDVSLSTPSGDTCLLEVRITPLSSGDDTQAVSVIYSDVTVHRRLEEELKQAKGDLEQAYEELQSTVEELETTNEELQSTNEELETTNEELQSTNEELETMNAELQSTNDELETINEELRQRTGELHEVNVFLETILTSLGVAVVVLDPQQRVQIWNAHSAELWGLRSDETVGQPFLDLDIGLPVQQLEQPLSACLQGASGREELTLAATNRRGRPVQCQVTVLPMRDDDEDVAGLIVLVEAQPERA
jgi:two-component system CheB/CheR fusion protein